MINHVPTGVLQLCLNGGLDGLHIFRRLKTGNDGTVAVDEELREVPLDARLLVVVNILLAEHPVKQGTQLVFEIEAAKGLSPSVSALQR